MNERKRGEETRKEEEEEKNRERGRERETKRRARERKNEELRTTNLFTSSQDGLLLLHIHPSTEGKANAQVDVSKRRNILKKETKPRFFFSKKCCV